MLKNKYSHIHFDFEQNLNIDHSVVQFLTNWLNKTKQLSFSIMFLRLPVFPPISLFFYIPFFFLSFLFLHCKGSGIVQWSRSNWHLGFQSSTGWCVKIRRSVSSIEASFGLWLLEMRSNQMEKWPSTDCEASLQVACGHHFAACILYCVNIGINRYHIVDCISRIQFAFP